MTPRTVEIGETGVVTTCIGLGCASLFHLPRPDDRAAVLRTAFDEGVRHFDVAPMYGFGLAEPELGRFLRGRRDQATITTKFGIDPSALGRAAGRLQRPVRSALRHLPQVGSGLKSAGRGPGSGWMGRALYSPIPYTPDAARRSLDRSLAMLGSDHVDVFLVHDPDQARLADSSELADYLASEVTRGRIRSWGSATDVHEPSGEVAALGASSPVLQFRDDLLAPRSSVHPGGRHGVITFGILDRTLPALAAYLGRADVDRDGWSQRFGFDLRAHGALPDLLLRQALFRNPRGPVLYSSTRTERVRGAARLAGTHPEPAALQGEAALLAQLGDAAVPRHGAEPT